MLIRCSSVLSYVANRFQRSDSGNGDENDAEGIREATVVKGFAARFGLIVFTIHAVALVALIICLAFQYVVRRRALNLMLLRIPFSVGWPVLNSAGNSQTLSRTRLRMLTGKVRV